MAPPALPAAGPRVARQSTIGLTGRPSSVTPVKPSSNRLSVAPKQGLAGRRASVLSGGSRQNSSTSLSSGGQGGDGDSPPPLSKTPDLLSPRSERSGTTALSGISAGNKMVNTPKATMKGATAMNREVEDMKAKLRIMEKKRMDDREKLKTLDRLQQERDKFETVIKSMQNKYQPQGQEIADLRKQLKEADAKVEEIETQQAEHEMIVEMATLDREMAEETAESYLTELDALRQKTEELELEVEVLREENSELGTEMSPEEKSSKGWLQMERQNERLREALMKLRDMSEEHEAELKDQIKSLEEDIQELSGVKEHYETTKEKLLISDSNIEDLRQQLDVAESAEEMLEELTEKNMSLSEKIEEMRAVIEDLESLKELNEEIEVQHVEAAKELQTEIDDQTNHIGEQSRYIAKQEEVLSDHEYTITKFRDLVTTLQSDLQDMKASHQLTETEASDLTDRSRAMMDLNMKLQLTAAKAQVKTIDLELGKLDASQAAEHLAIVQLFLPEAFDADRDSVQALLRFKRVAFKSNLLHGFVKERVSGPVSAGHEDDVMAGCDVLDKLTWVNAMCERFVQCISSCSVQQFARFEGALYELEPVERALNGWIDGLRRDELKEKQCADELQRYVSFVSRPMIY
jgi:dynactin 1